MPSALYIHIYLFGFQFQKFTRSSKRVCHATPLYRYTNSASGGHVNMEHYLLCKVTSVIYTLVTWKSINCNNR